MAEQVSKQHIQVLCIDDDEIVLRTLLRLLSANNITAKACSDPLEGLKVLATYSFDVIICDMRTNMDGADSLRKHLLLTQNHTEFC